MTRIPLRSILCPRRGRRPGDIPVLALIVALTVTIPGIAAAGPQSTLPQNAAIADLVKMPRTQRLLIPKLNGPIKLDGLSDEPAWNDVVPFPMIQESPVFGVAASERSETLVAYDDQYLYAAGRLFDREPEKIQAPTKKRDAMIASTDWFGIIIDTFNDKENALVFFTTPTGLRFDCAVFSDGVAKTPDPMDMPINFSWNAFWDVESVRTPEGWFVEMRIPLSSLRFQDRDGRVVMGLTCARWIARKNENDVFPAIPANWGQNSAWKPSQAQEVEFQGLYARNPLYIAPYVLGGGGYSYDLNDEETAYVRSEPPKFEAGLDVKYGLTSNLTLDLTVNTDFAQVEADDAQVNLTRYSIFFPEKRVFFQERSSNFDFTLGSTSMLFYSRRIGLYEGQRVPILGGTRLVGRLGGWDVGILDMQTAAIDELPSENFGVVRLRRQVFNPYSYIGGMVTSRIGADGSYNAAYGLDGIFRLAGDDYLSLHWAQSFENGAANKALSLDPSKFTLRWEHRTQKGWGADARVSYAGPAFNPGMGFMSRENYTAARVQVLHGWFPGEASPLFSHTASVEATAFWANGDGRLESGELWPGWEFSWKSGWLAKIAPRISFEDVAEEIEFSESARIPVGRYTFGELTGMIMSPVGNLFSGLVMIEAGSFYDGRRISLSFIPQWNIIDDLELSGMLQYNDVRFPGRGQTFLAPVAQLKLLATFSRAFSASVLAQYNGGDGAAGVNVRLRYNPKEGTDVYLVYNEGLNTDRFSRTPIPPLSGGRTIALKFNYTFNASK